MSEIIKTNVKCLKCSSREIVFSEIWVGQCINFRQGKDGNTDIQSGYPEAGNPSKIMATCMDCGKYWSLRGKKQITD